MAKLTRITRDAFVMGGKPCIRGMRVTVATVVGLVAAGHTTEEVLRQYPYLEAADIAEALSYAAWRAAEVEVPWGGNEPFVDRADQAHPDALALKELHQRATRPTLTEEHEVTRKVEAIYTGGVLKPTSDLRLKDQQRVRLTVETIDEPAGDRKAAVARLKTGIASMGFFSAGPLPSREELHDRD